MIWKRNVFTYYYETFLAAIERDLIKKKYSI